MWLKANIFWLWDIKRKTTIKYRIKRKIIKLQNHYRFSDAYCGNTYWKRNLNAKSKLKKKQQPNIKKWLFIEIILYLNFDVQQWSFEKENIGKHYFYKLSLKLL